MKSCYAREGELRNRDSILWSPHLYTVSFDQLFIGRGCPKIYSDFVDKVYELMLNRTPQTVYAKYGRSIINTKQGIRKHLDNDRSSQKRRDQPGHILLYGPEGRGKKYKADIIAQEIGNKTSYINGA